MAVAKGARRPLRERLKRYFRESRAELRKVSWPNRKELTTYTLVVIFTTAVVSIFVGLVDLLFSQLFGLLRLVGR
ncbi:MAG: preprotein translocase subunit SecE [Limnochordia bacterium]|jgi:preprotein translocase subunit SecE